MPNKSAAIKALKQSVKRTRKNVLIKDTLKNLIKNTRKAISENKVEEAQKFMKTVIQSLDKAAHKGVIKKNFASRKKSRLTRLFNSHQIKKE